MALVTGSDYDHFDLHPVSGGDVTRHMLKDAQARQDVSDLTIAIWQAMGGIADYNLFGSAGFVHGYYINAQGVETAGTGFAHTGIISVTPSQTYHFSGTGINRQTGWTMRFHAYQDGVWKRQLVAVSVPGTGDAIEQDMTLVSGENGVVISFVDGAIENPVFVGPNGETAIDKVARAQGQESAAKLAAVTETSGGLLTAKDAVARSMLGEDVQAIWDAIADISDYNLFGSSGFKLNYYISENGTETYGLNFECTNLIPVDSTQTYRFTANAVDRGSGWTLRFHAYIDGEWHRQMTAISVPANGGAIDQTLQFQSAENGIRISFVHEAMENAALSNADGVTAIDRVARAMFADYFKCTSASVLPSGDLNNYYNVSGSWLMDSNHRYTNTPDGLNAGFLLCYAARNFTLQIFYPFTQNYIYKRRGNANSWNAWGKIIADTSDVLQSTGDTTNRTADILSRLTADKVCRLGDGVFYVQSLDMPDDSAIIGSGAGTKIILLGTDATEGYAVKLGSRCSIAHVSILGNAEDHTAQGDRYDRTAAYVERHGILWQGTITASTSGDTARRANVTDCYIANFSGGGITLQKTGLNTITGINVSDVYIWHCYAGINVAYYSEFNRFANVSVGFCHYGAINNGGNNAFVNCNFSANIEGMLIDNTNGKSPNNSHGSVANCIFDHSDQNYGIGIHLIGVSYGEVFSNCQLFYSEIVAENCNGIVFTSLNAGNHENITVKNSKCVIFSGCMFRGIPYFITTGNQKMIVRDCLAYGETPPADVVLSNVNVTAMPVDFTGAIGQTATFSVTAENVASYQWQWRYADHSSNWTNTTATGNTTESISVEITAARLTYEYRCVMRDASGNAAYTDTVRIIQS